jgi:hypothetical protein
MVTVTVDNKSLETTVSVKSGRKKLYDNRAFVVEAFREKYIKVDLVDEDDHHFKLNWEDGQYVGNFFGTTLICTYEVKRDFKADISAPKRNEAGPAVVAVRSNGGRPNRYKE